MGRRGRQPKPTALSVHRGGAAAGRPTDPPAEVSADPVALETWHRTLASLQELELWHRADAAIVARYCVMTALFRRCLAEVNTDGMAMATTTGYQAVRPAASQMIKFASQLNVMESSLGLTAKARSRMKVAAPAGPDPLDEFLAAYP